MTMNLNARAVTLVDRLIADADAMGVVVSAIEGGGRLVDAGIGTRGGLRAGIELAGICMAGLGEASIVPGSIGDRPWPAVQVVVDRPAIACLASQYAGWQLSEGTFFAMGSGPMRAAAGREPIVDRVGGRERAEAVVGVLEGRVPPPPSIVAKVAEATGVPRDAVTLIIAPTASLAGTLQVVARSAETAIHKLAEIGFDLGRVVSAVGVAPLPPVARGDLAAIGRTNDAILYGARVVLHVVGDDASLAEVGPRVPSTGSKDHGEPFAAIFERYGRDFYAVDPALFSPAEIAFSNLDTGTTLAFGRSEPSVVARSFGLA